jgi:DNA-binding phage protein
MMDDTRNGRPGSTLDDFLAEEGVLEEATEHAVKSVLAWQIGEAMRQRNLTKAAMAREMRTSRTQLDRLLDPDNASVTLHTLHRAAAVLGKRLRVDLIG